MSTDEVCYICKVKHDLVTGRGEPFCSRSWHPDSESRPWGGFQTIAQAPGYLVKRISVLPNARFSLQYHLHRDEIWTVVHGEGYVYTCEQGSLNASLVTLRQGQVIHIPKNVLHRMKGGPQGVVFIEVQLGDILDETDIVRLEDDFGRVP